MTGAGCEDEFEKVIAAYLRVRAGTYQVLCAVFMHAVCLFLYLVPHTWTGRHDEQIHKGAYKTALDTVNLQ